MITRLHALGEPALDRAQVADAAAELHRNLDRARIASTAARIDRPAGEGAVEIDDMQPVEALALEVSRLRGRIVVEDRRLRHVALHEADAAAILEVDGGKEDHGRHLRKLAMQREAERLALLGMELRAGDIVASDDGGQRAAIVGLRDEQSAGSDGLQVIGVHEIGVQAIRPGRDAVEQRMRPADVERVPAHVRDLQRRIGRLDQRRRRRQSSRAPCS